LVDALVAPASRILDAGCGTGRVGAELARRGHAVVGVDVDPELVAAAAADHPGCTWLQADLAQWDLAVLEEPQPFDAAVLAGNVLPFLAPGTEVEVLRRVGNSLRSGGVIAVGFGLGRGYTLTAFDADVTAAGLALEHRFATWDLRPWTADADFAVSILRRP
jgi:trans-aconitate methyltransferase